MFLKMQGREKSLPRETFSEEGLVVFGIKSDGRYWPKEKRFPVD